MSNQAVAVQNRAIANSETSLLEVIERAARDPSVDIAKMERLFAMVEHQQERRAEQAFSDAMNKAQEEMRSVSKDASNPQTRSKYASYGALDNACRPIYTKHGFSLSFSTDETADPANSVRVICKIAHRDGHSEHPSLVIPIDTKGPQGKDVMTPTHATMSAVSYARRGLLKMVFNLAEGEHDDDGNAAGGRGNVDRGTITAEQEKTLMGLMVDNQLDVAVFKKWAGIEVIGDLPAAIYGKAFAILQEKIKAKKAQANAGA